MTPQEKARELVEDFMSVRMEIKTKMDSIPTVISDYPSPDTAKKCALIAVNEIISIAYWEYMDSGTKEERQYWQQVKTEIEKL